MIPKRDAGPKPKPKRTTRSPTAGRSAVVRTRLHVRPTDSESSPQPTLREVPDNRASLEQQLPQQTTNLQYQHQMQLVRQTQQQSQRQRGQRPPRRSSGSPKEQNMDTSAPTGNSDRPLGPTLLPAPTPQAANATTNNNNRVSLRLANVPLRWSLLDIYQIFEGYGQIEYLEVYEDNFGERNGRGKIVFG